MPVTPIGDIFSESAAFRAFFEQAPVGIFFFDPDDPAIVMPIAACNLRAAQMHGYTPAELLGQSIREIDPGFLMFDGEKDIYDADAFVASLQSGGVTSGLAHHLRRDRTLLVVEYQTLLLMMQGKRYVVGVEQDVTVREAEREELDVTRQLLIDAIESIDDGLMLFDPEDHLVAFNRKATRVLSQVADFIETGASYQSIMAAYAARLDPQRRIGLGPEEFAERGNAHRKAFAKNLPFNFEPGHHHRLSHWPTQEGGVVSVVTDVTDLYRAVERAEESSRAKSDFLGVISWELQTPLDGMRGLIERLQTTDLTDAHRRLVEMLSKSVHRLDAVLTDILDLSLLERNELRLQPQTVSFGHLLRKVGAEWASQAHDKGLGFHLTLDAADGDEAELDPMRVFYVLDSLIGNAVKFTAHGSVDVHAKVNQHETFIEVSDTGPGIHPDLHEAIFEPFRLGDMSLSRPQGGLGVGLAKARALVRMMGGDMNVVNGEQVGCRFTFRIPQRNSSERTVE